MQLKLKRKGDYSVRAMIHVAHHHGDGLRQARQIASEMQVPYKYLTQILTNLVAEGLLEASNCEGVGAALVSSARSES